MSVRVRGRVLTTMPANKAGCWKPHESSATDGCWLTWATGLPPHQYVIARRVERAKHLLQGGADVSLPEVCAAHAGFCDQSPFSHHFKRLLGVTPGRFRSRISNAQDSVSPAKKPERRASWDSVRSGLRKDEG
jgi:methylphosphotriester-DNA--protein-cysteine methyltransferase